MEKKTLGSFLAALRKANGLTQRELAEKLSVSDKAVSRWERDECAPDLTLIPVIAEIFGITADELLRGQRNNPDSIQPEKAPEKTRKQLARILEENRTRFLIRSLIALGVGLVGLIAAMICNLGFLRAYIGFFVGCVFYVTAGILEASFATLAFSAVKGDDFPAEEVTAHRQTLKTITLIVTFVLVLLFAVTLPLLIMCYDAYWGISGETWLQYGTLYGLMTAAILLAAYWIIRGVRLHQTGNDEGDAIILARKRRKLQKKIIGIVVAAMLVTFIGQGVFNVLLEPVDFVGGIVFHNMDDFREFAETPVTGQNYYGDEYSSSEVYEYYNEYGEPISEDEALTQYLEEALTRYLFEEGDDNYKYIARNDSIAMIRPLESGRFPIEVYTDAQWTQGNGIMQAYNVGFMALYFLEILAGVIFYLKKRKSI